MLRGSLQAQLSAPPGLSSPNFFTAAAQIRRCVATRSSALHLHSGVSTVSVPNQLNWLWVRLWAAKRHEKIGTGNQNSKTPVKTSICDWSDLQNLFKVYESDSLVSELERACILHSEEIVPDWKNPSAALSLIICKTLLMSCRTSPKSLSILLTLP